MVVAMLVVAVVVVEVSRHPARFEIALPFGSDSFN